MSYDASGRRRKRKGRGLLVGLVIFFIGIVAASGILWNMYQRDLRPVGDNRTVTITISPGENTKNIAANFKEAGLIQDARSFELYARLHKLGQYLQAGDYEINSSQSVPEIVSQLTRGKVATSLVTILPGKRLDQIRQALIEQGFTEADVDAALDPVQYEASALLAGKPAGASLEGYLYPDTFQKTATTKAKTIVDQSMAELQERLTPEIKAGFSKQGLSTYQGITLASVVEKEVTNQSDRAQAAQVFLARYRKGISLGSDVTAFYGSELAGKGKDLAYDTPYNTRIHTGLPYGPISNVSESSLQAVANPANTEWLFFVSGDDGVTYFSKTVEEHEALAAQYCIKLCQE